MCKLKMVLTEQGQIVLSTYVLTTSSASMYLKFDDLLETGCNLISYNFSII